MCARSGSLLPGVYVASHGAANPRWSSTSRGQCSVTGHGDDDGDGDEDGGGGSELLEGNQSSLRS